MTGAMRLASRLSSAAAKRACVLVLAAALSACSAAPKPVKKAEINNTPQFTAKEVGVPASPRVTENREVPKGGGRYQVGKPYKVRGKWYTPKEDPTYVATGRASWYGPNFHGRLTANGEIYNQYNLSAAHPTMPLPSYARVTNLKNNTSVIVRVNDRGPYAHGRVIDVSSKAADLLGFKSAGITDVKVEYVGRARVEGSDEKFLLASLRGPGSPEPGLTTPGSMLAMAPDARPAPADPLAQADILLASADVPVPTPRPANIAIGMPFLVASAGQAPLSFAAEMPAGRFAAAFSAVDRDEDRFAFALSTDAAAANREAVVSFGVFKTSDAAEFARLSLADLGVVSSRPAQGGWELTMIVGGDAADAGLAQARARGYGQARLLGPDLN